MADDWYFAFESSQFSKSIHNKIQFENYDVDNNIMMLRTHEI